MIFDRCEKVIWRRHFRGDSRIAAWQEACAVLHYRCFVLSKYSHLKNSRNGESMRRADEVKAQEYKEDDPRVHDGAIATSNSATTSELQTIMEVSRNTCVDTFDANRRSQKLKWLCITHDSQI